MKLEITDNTSKGVEVYTFEIFIRMQEKDIILVFQKYLRQKDGNKITWEKGEFFSSIPEPELPGPIRLRAIEEMMKRIDVMTWDEYKPEKVK